MKKFCVAVGLALVFGLYTLTGCASGSQESGSVPTEPQTGTQEELHNYPEHGDLQNEDTQEGMGSPKEEDPAVSPLAVLDTVDVSAAFGDRNAEGWSFALRANGDLSASYGFRFTSEITNEEKVNLECGVGIGLEDLFGIRSQENSAFGFGLFGGGTASLYLNYRGSAGDDPTRKSYDVGFRHDGDLIWYAGEGENEAQTSLSELQAEIEGATMTETFEGMKNAFTVIPEEIQKGASLRFAVEKLIDLGFTAEIDDSDGIAVSLKANVGFYTALLNDMLENFIPAEWLDYLPRADFGYERTVFNIKLAFDKDGMFKEYSMSSDVVLTASLQVRQVFFSESKLTLRGSLAFAADPNPAQNEGDSAQNEFAPAQNELTPAQDKGAPANKI